METLVPSSAWRLFPDVDEMRISRDAGTFLSSVAAPAGRFGSRRNVGESWIPADLADIGGEGVCGVCLFPCRDRNY